MNTDIPTFPDMTLEQFKQGIAEFIKAAPTLDRDSLENGFKAAALMYLAMKPEHLADTMIAKSYLEFASARYFERDRELFRQEF